MVANQIGMLHCFSCIGVGIEKEKKKKKKEMGRKTDSVLSAGISLTILAMLLACHNLYPSLRPYTTPFFQLSYYQPSQDVYVQGWDDLYFVLGSAIAFTAIRAITIEWVFQPLARKAGLKRKASVRFAEQGWLWVYYGFFWTFGMVRLLYRC